MDNSTDNRYTLETSSDNASGWQIEFTHAACTNCQATYLIHSAKPTEVCPRCLHKGITIQTSEQVKANGYTPELIIPHSTTQAAITRTVTQFAAGIPYPPADLTAENILQRLQPLYLSAWLVDVKVQADWQAEMGYDYQVVSHQDRYDQAANRWMSHEVKETRINWEPRLGNLTRDYPNISAPALDNENTIRQSIGDFNLSTAQMYQPDLLADQAYIQMPDRPSADAWNDAVINLQRQAAEECRLAGKADHIRNFRWEPRYDKQNWTLMLRPIYTSYYLDDNRQPHIITIHGTTGALNGSQIASMHRAQSRALTIVIIAAAIFFIGLLLGAVGILFPPALLLAGLMLFVSLAVAVGAVVPLVQVWQFNRQS